MIRHDLTPRCPAALKIGDRIGVSAPAGPFDLPRYRIGLSRLIELGFSPHCPSQIHERNGFLAGPDDRRAETFNLLAGDPDISAVIAARGGHGSMRILDRVDTGLFRDRAKIVMGFSDLTALLWELSRSSRMVVFHGPVVTSLAKADKETLDHMYRLLTGQKVFPISLGSGPVIVPGRAEGPLFGGNLTLITHLLATPWMPDLEGAILFLEDVSEAPYRLDRMLFTLRAAGVLDRCRGILLGDFEDCGPADEIFDVLENAFRDFHGPVVAGFPIGHGARNLALPIGPAALLDTHSGTLDMLEPYLA